MLCLKPILCNHGEKEERMSYLNKKYLATTLLLQIVDFFSTRTIDYFLRIELSP